jgi:hypothetical protein
MLSIEDLESACNTAQRVEPHRHSIEAPELPFQATFYPFGFPAVVRTNSESVLKHYDELWGKFRRQQDTEPLRAEVQVVDSHTTTCPPEPTYRYMQPLMMCVADNHNYSMVDLECCQTKIVISRAALRHRLYAQYFILGTAACCVATRYTTPVHAGCVALDGRGVLLCGDSGAGKSSLSYACARAGWTYVSDDGSFLLNGGTRRLVTGDCHKVRFRPSAAELFPEIAGFEITPRAAGSSPPQLVPYRRDVARHFMRQTLYGPPELLSAQYRAVERLLTVDVFELRYTDLDWAVDRLQKLVREGR